MWYLLLNWVAQGQALSFISSFPSWYLLWINTSHTCWWSGDQAINFSIILLFSYFYFPYPRWFHTRPSAFPASKSHLKSFSEKLLPGPSREGPLRGGMPGGWSERHAKHCDLQTILAQKTFQSKPLFASLAWDEGIVLVMTHSRPPKRLNVSISARSQEGNTYPSLTCWALSLFNDNELNLWHMMAFKKIGYSYNSID